MKALGNLLLRGVAVASSLMCMGALSLNAQMQETRPPHFVRASGEATVVAKPDEAEITVGVSTHGSTAQAASAQNAEQSSQVIAALKQVLGTGGEIKTSGYSLSPQYTYENGHAPRLNGYEANNTVDVKVTELALVGKIIDAATATGANNVSGISFGLHDTSAIRAKALAEAAVVARSNAEAIAKALGVQVMGVLQAEPTEIPTVRPLLKTFAAPAMAERVSTPIESGDLDVRASVTVTLEIR